MNGRLSCMLFGIGAFLVAMAVYLVELSNSTPLPPFAIEHSDRDFGDLPVGVHDVVFRIGNPAIQARRIIGVADG